MTMKKSPRSQSRAGIQEAKEPGTQSGFFLLALRAYCLVSLLATPST